MQCSCFPKVEISFWQIWHIKVNICYNPLFDELMQVFLTALI